MFAVRNIYRDKAYNYVMRQGKANFSQGSLAHDLIRAYKMYGAIPESVYSGKEEGDKIHDHSEMENALKGMLEGVIKSKQLSDDWMEAVDGVLDAYMGEVPETFSLEGKVYTPETYRDMLNLNATDYVHMTSFNHHPYYEDFILELPDNYSNGSYYNLPLIEMMQVIDNALAKGFSVAWDGDVSEKGFSGRKGIAVLPEDDQAENVFANPVKEINVTQEVRQEGFESYDTTDDHLMHIIGTAVDQKGQPYYILKNSWGEINPYEGYIYMSRPYMAMKTIALTVHKDAIPGTVRTKLNMD